MKFKCNKCQAMAVWFYMPSSIDINSSFKCDNCVPRGCSCNMKCNFGIDGEQLEEPYEEYKDDQGRLLPCCEFDFNEEGFNEEDFKDE